MSTKKQDIAYEWIDLPKPLNCFTVRSATMTNLNTGKIMQHYSANTKIVVVQKCIIPECTYYRTQEAARHNLNYAFEASAFGLKNEKAPLVPSKSISLSNRDKPKNKTRTLTLEKKQKSVQKDILPKSGEAKCKGSWLKRLFRRKNG